MVKLIVARHARLNQFHCRLCNALWNALSTHMVGETQTCKPLCKKTNLHEIKHYIDWQACKEILLSTGGPPFCFPPLLVLGSVFLALVILVQCAWNLINVKPLCDNSGSKKRATQVHKFWLLWKMRLLGHTAWKVASLSEKLAGMQRWQLPATTACLLPTGLIKLL